MRSCSHSSDSAMVTTGDSAISGKMRYVGPVWTAWKSSICPPAPVSPMTTPSSTERPIGGQLPAAAPERVQRRRNHRDRPHHVDECLGKAVIRGHAGECAPHAPEERGDEGVDEPRAAAHQQDPPPADASHGALRGNRFTVPPVIKRNRKSPNLSTDYFETLRIRQDERDKVDTESMILAVSKVFERSIGRVCGRMGPFCTFTR